MASGAIDDGRVGYILAIVDHNGPEIDKDEEEHRCVLLQRENEREDMVWD